jgi:penicillin-binding protein 1A
VKRLAHLLLALSLLVILAGVTSGAVFFAFVLRDLPEIYTLQDYRPKLITRVLDATDREIATFSRERRVVVPIEEIPDHVVHAFIAAEDSSFYEHEGLDYPGILRAAITNLRAGKVRQGGSTITQQVAKTFLLSSDRNYVRKLKDMVLAMRIERAFNKNEILFLYLNQIYLGSGAYGVESAAHTYFDKSARELTLAESALIAGLVPAPSKYTPRNSPENAFKRQRFVLRRMTEDGFISEDQRETALAVELEFREPEQDETAVAAAYFVEEVRRYLVQRYGAEEVLTGGLEVKTSLDPQRQRDAYKAVRKGLREHDRRSGFRGPIRNVPRDEWAELLAQIGEENDQRTAKSPDLWRALVMSVDDEAQEVRLAVGPGRETVLTLENLNWARPPDPELDGIVPRVKLVSQALHVGDLVLLEKVGEKPAEASAPAIPQDSSDEVLADLFEVDLAVAEPIPIFELYQEPRAEGSLVSIDLETKHLVAMIGGYSFERSQLNRALQSPRQPGSAFKPIIYAAALEQGYTPATIVYDTPIVYVDEDSGFQWKPENYSDKFYGPIPLRQALAKSRNIATIKILRDIRLDPVQAMALRLGIRSRLEDNLGLALGNSEVTLGELVRAYTTFATGGRRIDPIFIREIRNRDGELLEENVPLLASLEEAEIEDGEFEFEDTELQEEQEEQDELERVIGEIREVVLLEEDPALLPEGYSLDPVTAYLMTDMLRAVVQEGTGFRVRELRRPVAGKTGTTNNLFDAWFIGYTPQIATGVWVGYDQPRDLGKNETGSRAASPIFLDYMQRALHGKNVEDFVVPDGVVFARIDRETGLLARPSDEKILFQPFRDGTAPEEVGPERLQNGGPGRAPRLD